MSNNKIEMNPELKKIYDIIKKNDYHLQEITESIDSMYTNIVNSDFEGNIKDILIDTITQIGNDMSKIKDLSNTIINKENKLNNQFRQNLEELKKLIDETNELKAQKEILTTKLNTAIANQRRLNKEKLEEK